MFGGIDPRRIGNIVKEKRISFMRICSFAAMSLATTITMIALSTRQAYAEFDSTKLFAKGNWFVERTHDTGDGDLWCSAETSNRNRQTFSLAAYDDGTFALFVFDQRWNVAERPVRFLVDIDYSRWTIDGTGRGIGISLTISDAEKAAEFLTELSEGNAVAVMNSDEKRVAVFSLNGSSAAIRKLFECWKEIGTKDPFSNASDPFQSSSDPF